MDATVAICTYNGSKRLLSVLQALSGQKAGAAVWEVLVVDNASNDDTSEVAARHFRELRLIGRVVREEQLGLSFARWRAAMEAKSEIICFLDDDNIPNEHFVANAVAAFHSRPKAGSIGGKVLPAWESKPTALAVAVAGFALAVCDQGERAFRYEHITSGPVGAGMCVRRELLKHIYSCPAFLTEIPGRKGRSLSSGEDTALAVRIHKAGYECWYEPSLVIHHMLPAHRMQKDYLLRLFEGIGRGQSAVRRLHDWKARNRVVGYLIAAKDLCRWLGGRVRGPSPMLICEYGALATDLHDLYQRQTLGRALHFIQS
jgi:GT2 family glycosyltransferase